MYKFYRKLQLLYPHGKLNKITIRRAGSEYGKYWSFKISVVVSRILSGSL